jgi:hypothetical protein
MRQDVSHLTSTSPSLKLPLMRDRGDAPSCRRMSHSWWRERRTAYPDCRQAMIWRGHDSRMLRTDDERSVDRHSPHVARPCRACSTWT